MSVQVKKLRTSNETNVAGIEPMIFRSALTDVTLGAEGLGLLVHEWLPTSPICGSNAELTITTSQLVHFADGSVDMRV